MNLLVIFAVTLAAFLLVIAGMAVGVMAGRREISGSCGGLGAQNSEGGETSCSLCSNPDAACKELGRRMQGEQHIAAKDCETSCESATGCGDGSNAAISASKGD